MPVSNKKIAIYIYLDRSSIHGKPLANWLKWKRGDKKDKIEEAHKSLLEVIKALSTAIYPAKIKRKFTEAGTVFPAAFRYSSSAMAEGHGKEPDEYMIYGSGDYEPIVKWLTHNSLRYTIHELPI
jgi:hypothetical protein